MELIQISNDSMFAILSKERTETNSSIDFRKAREQFNFSSYIVVSNKPEFRANGEYKCIKSLIESEHGEIDFKIDNLIIFKK